MQNVSIKIPAWVSIEYRVTVILRTLCAPTPDHVCCDW